MKKQFTYRYTAVLVAFFGWMLLGMSLSQAQTCATDSVLFSLTAYNGTVQWEESTDGINWTPISGATSSSLMVYPSVRTMYRAGIYEGTCNVVYSDMGEVFPVSPISVTASGPLTFCAGGSVTLSAGPAVSYLWSNGDTTASSTISTSGSYTVVATDSNGCSSTSSVFVVDASGTAPADSITFNYSGSIISWVVPSCVDSVRIDAWGASGGNSTWSTFFLGGNGAFISGRVDVTPGQVLRILVGQQGETAAVGGGGGGTFVVDSLSSQPLMVAGGGGGASSDQAGLAASITTSGTADGLNIQPGGTNGNGGAACALPAQNNGGGGGGLLTNGQDANAPGSTNGGYGGKSFLNGGAGGVPGRQDLACTADAYGGFGGGGSTSCNTVGGGGGGGYSGGGGGPHISQCGANIRAGGGGGGSFNGGVNQTNTAGVQVGNGMVKIVW